MWDGSNAWRIGKSLMRNERETVSERPPCSMCGMPYHRYGWGDREHDYDPTACINSLRGEIERLQLWHEALEGEDDE